MTVDQDRLNKVKSIQRPDCLKFEEFDLAYNVETFGPRKLSTDGLKQIQPAVHENSDLVLGSNGYQPTALYWIDVVNDYLNSNEDLSKYSFVDIGCGKGKVIFHNLSQNQNYKEYIGIEADENFYNIAVKNLKTTNIKINKNLSFYHINALDYDYNQDHVIYYFFYPFSKEIFDSIFNNNLLKMKNKNNYLVFIFESDFEVESVVGYPPVFVNEAITIYKLD